MIGRDELRRWVDYFGAPESQVRRDHLVSHVLVHLPELAAGATFFGGTALCRTHLRDRRLSEDIDLLVESVSEVSNEFDAHLPRLLRREYPGVRLRWDPVGEIQTGDVRTDDVNVRLQLVLMDSSLRMYPTASTDVSLRYDDLPTEFRFKCPTPAGAAAMKLNAWGERFAPRDLCDLYGLVKAGALTAEALAIASSASRSVQPHSFDATALPSESSWQAALGNQMREPPPREVALATVRSTVARLAGWDDG